MSEKDRDENERLDDELIEESDGRAARAEERSVADEDAAAVEDAESGRIPAPHP